MATTNHDYESIPVMPYADAVQDGQAPLFCAEIDLHGVTNYVVKLADGSFGRLQQSYPLGAGVVQGVPRATRKYLQDWIDRVEPDGRVPVSVLKFKRKLLNTSEMREFWDWFERVEYKSVRYLQSSSSVTDMILRATKLPGKPGNMTPKQRERYFQSIKKHANALREGLNNTL